MKTLIIVSGGDAPGINTAISHYCALAAQSGDDCLGAHAGFEGVLDDAITPVDLATVRQLAGRGGTVFASSRAPVLKQPDAQDKLQAVLARHDVDNVLLFGGDGTLRHVLPLLHDWNIPTIGLPTTIDNDVAATDRTLGHDSACNFAYAAVDGIVATAHALRGRIFMIETLGGDTGYLALTIAAGSGAHAVLVPEYDFEMDWFAQRLKNAINQHQFALVVLSEGVQEIPQFEEAIPRLTGVRLRYTRLGHAQRGGDVSHLDRTLALDMARLAHQGFHNDVGIGAVLVHNGHVHLHEGTIDTAPKAPPNRELYEFINRL